jgi:hypothetical protein
MALSRRAALVVGVVTLVVTLPNVEEGLRAGFVFSREGQWLPAGIGLLAGVAGLGLLAVGVRLAARGLAAMRLAQVAAAASIVAHAVGVSVGPMGVLAGLLGILYPLILLVLLRGTPTTGTPAAVTEPGRERRPDDEDRRPGRLRSATA